MSTVIPNNSKDIEKASSNHAAPKHLLKSAYDLVLAALNGNKKVVLITGGAKKGKTALMHTISKNIASTNRIINLSGKDLPSLEKSKNNISTPELNNMKDFILESTDLDDTLVVIVDDVDLLPINFISDLVAGTKKSISNDHDMQLILSAPLSYKEQLLNIEQLSAEDIAHCTLDSISEEEIHSYAKNKTYKISSNIKRLEFKPASLQALADFIQSDQQILDVVLEWCAALAKKDQLTSITPHTVNRAAGFAQQFSKDKNLRLVNSYPPSHEVYKYINDIQSAKNPSTKVKKKSVKKPIKNKANKPFIKTGHRNEIQATKIPTITSKIKHEIQDKPAAAIDKEVLQNLKEIEDEIMPTQWTKPPKQSSSGHKKSFPAMAGLLSIVVIGFIAFIAYRIGSSPDMPLVNEAPPKEQVALHDVIDEAQEVEITPAPAPSPFQDSLTDKKKEITIAEPNLVDEITDLKSTTTEPQTQAEKVKQIIAKNENTETVATSHTGITATDTNSPADINLNTPTKNSATGTVSDNTKLATNGPADTSLDEKLPKTKEADKEIVSSTTEINSLLALAEYQFKNKQMSTPLGDNSLETYQKILAK